jgi:hypothetical protein
MKKTHAVIIRLITLTIETGTATATVALVSLMLFFSIPSQIYFITPSFLAAKLYANTVVLIFNNRAQIRQAESHVTHSTMSMDGVRIRQDTGMSGVTASQLHFATNSLGDGVQVSKSVSIWEDNKNADLEVKPSSILQLYAVLMEHYSVAALKDEWINYRMNYEYTLIT